MINIVETGKGILLNKEILNMIASVFVGVITGYATIKANRSNISDKINRGQWYFEMFVMFYEKYRASKFRDKDAYLKFCSFTLVLYSYVDKKLKPYVLEIKDLVENNKKEDAKEKMITFIDMYCKVYKLKKYEMSKRLFIKDFNGNIKD